MAVVEVVELEVLTELPIQVEVEVEDPRSF
jgi:hypothetical protein